MTNEERHRIIGEMVEELRILRSNEPCLVTKLQKMMEAVEIAAAVSAAVVLRKEPHKPWRLAEDGKLFFGPSEDAVEFPAPDELASCLQELVHNRERAAVLRERIDAC